MKLYTIVFLIGIPLFLLIGIIIKLSSKESAEKVYSKHELLSFLSDAKRKILTYAIFLILFPFIIPIGDLIFSRRIPLTILIVIFLLASDAIALSSQLYRFYLIRRKLKNKVKE